MILCYQLSVKVQNIALLSFCAGMAFSITWIAQQDDNGFEHIYAMVIGNTNSTEQKR
jgi:hypothetical protein